MKKLLIIMLLSAIIFLCGCNNGQLYKIIEIENPQQEVMPYKIYDRYNNTYLLEFAKYSNAIHSYEQYYNSARFCIVLVENGQSRVVYESKRSLALTRP